MKLTILALFAALLLSTVAFGQSVKTPKTEIVVDGLFVRENPNFTKPSFKYNHATDQFGASLGVARYFGDKSPFGLNLEIADTATGRSATSANLATATAGVIFKSRTSKVAPFLKLNGGVSRLAARNDLLKFNTANSGFAVVAGGGIDFKVKSFFIRLPEVDYVGTRIQGQTVNHIRAGVGLGVSF